MLCLEEKNKIHIKQRRWKKGVKKDTDTNSLAPYCFSTFAFKCLKHSSILSWKGRRLSETLLSWILIPAPRKGILMRAKQKKKVRISTESDRSSNSISIICWTNYNWWTDLWADTEVTRSDVTVQEVLAAKRQISTSWKGLLKVDLFSHSEIFFCPLHLMLKPYEIKHVSLK